MNPIQENISIDKVENFQIYENYEQSFPGDHICKISLIDGRKFKLSIFVPDIYILIQAIAKDKINFKRSKDPEELTWAPQDIHHFDGMSHWSYSAFKTDKSTQAPLPNDLLSSLIEKTKSKWNIPLSFDEVMVEAEQQFIESPFKESILKDIKYYLNGYRNSGAGITLDGRHVTKAPEEFLAAKKGASDFFERKDLFANIKIDYMQ